MACVRSIACLRDDVPVAEGEGAITERGAIDEGHDSAGSVEGTESMHASHAGSHSHVEGDSDEGSHTRSYYFGPLTVTVNCIREMINRGYFVEGSARAPVEETILEPDSDEAVVFEEFFPAGLRMPRHQVLTNILLKFQVHLHQLTPNAIG
jgi:hypothetical protein